VCHGKPVIKGTRVMVATVVGHVGAGDAVAEVANEYGVTTDDVLAAIAYAAEVVAVADAFVRALSGLEPSDVHGCLFIVDEHRVRARRPLSP
jgi:uncharacterized protein (DUF433 family)